MRRMDKKPEIQTTKKEGTLAGKPTYANPKDCSKEATKDFGKEDRSSAKTPPPVAQKKL